MPRILKMRNCKICSLPYIAKHRNYKDTCSDKCAFKAMIRNSIMIGKYIMNIPFYVIAAALKEEANRISIEGNKQWKEQYKRRHQR